MMDQESIFLYAVILWPLSCCALLLLVPTRSKRCNLPEIRTLYLLLYVAYVVAGFAALLVIKYLG